MSVTNKLSHSVFIHVFLESCLTKSWVCTATSASLETEICTKSLEWPFVKFMIKMSFKLLTKVTSEFVFTVCDCVCDSHVCVTPGAAAVSGLHCGWHWLQFWSFRKAPCRRRALTAVTSVSHPWAEGLELRGYDIMGFFPMICLISLWITSP